MDTSIRKMQGIRDDIRKLSLVIDSGSVLITSLSRKDSRNDSETDEQYIEEEDSLKNIHSPWGFFSTLTKGDCYQVKRISVGPKQRLSLQLHHHRSEHWTVIYGTARVTIGDHTFLMHEGESTFIPLLTLHRLENSGNEFLEVIEVQIGTHIAEDDIIRYADDYGRITRKPGDPIQETDEKIFD